MNTDALVTRYPQWPSLSVALRPEGNQRASAIGVTSHAGLFAALGEAFHTHLVSHFTSVVTKASYNICAFFWDDGAGGRKPAPIKPANDLAPDSRDSPTEARMHTDSTSFKPHNLIASDRVEGTPVRSTDGTVMGIIKRVMIDKRTGNIAYSVLSLNGSAGMGSTHLPIPWSRLTYYPNLAAYHLDLTETELSALSHGSEIDWGDRGRKHRYEPKVYWGIAETW